MRKGMWSAAAVVTLIVGGVAGFGAPPLRADNRVALGSDDEPLKFLPDKISVPVGTRVEWFNDTDVQHDVSAEDGTFDSRGLLGKGGKYEYTFSKAGVFKYFCTPHKDAGMTGEVTVTGAGAPTTAATTPTTQGGSSPTTATTAGGQGATTTTAAKIGAGGSSTTTTTAGSGVTSTTQAPSVTPTSAPDIAGETTATTAAAGGGEEAAAADHSSEGGHEEKEKKKNSPIGIAFAAVSTLLLGGISGKLLASKP
jgi:plastocyanin